MAHNNILIGFEYQLTSQWKICCNTFLQTEKKSLEVVNFENGCEGTRGYAPHTRVCF